MKQTNLCSVFPTHQCSIHFNILINDECTCILSCNIGNSGYKTIKCHFDSSVYIEIEVIFPTFCHAVSK